MVLIVLSRITDDYFSTDEKKNHPDKPCRRVSTNTGRRRVKPNKNLGYTEHRRFYFPRLVLKNGYKYIFSLYYIFFHSGFLPARTNNVIGLYYVF